VDTIRRLAEERHFYTAEIALADYGQALVIGDEAMVDHIRELIRQTGVHDLVDITDDENRLA
jgi:predicted solute-binding protein